MLATLKLDPRIGVVGPVLWEDGRLASAGGRDISRHMDTHLRPSQPPREVLDVDHVPGTAVLVSRTTFETVGLLNEDYFFGGELADLCHEARRQGLRCVIDPNAHAHHEHRDSGGLRETLHAYYSLRNRFLYIHRHCPGHRYWLQTCWAARGTLALAAALARGQPARARALALGLADGLKGLSGNGNDRILA
jgi:GT2 family glycosyltransferase